MSQAPTLIERAFEMARSGRCRSVDHIVKDLKGERYERVDEHLSPSLRRQLKAIIQGVTANSPGTPAG
jgi:hypothetical protein